MPYNNTPVPPPGEVSGSCALPLARIKKIIKADPDTGDCSNNAAFAIAIATEMFVQHLVERTQNIVKAEAARGKGRRNIQYKDIAAAVAKHDNLEFLADVVPNTIQFREYKKREGARVIQDDVVLPNGQQKLSWSAAVKSEDADMQGVNEPDSKGRINLSLGSTGAGLKAEHGFDAVRNSIDELGSTEVMDQD